MGLFSFIVAKLSKAALLDDLLTMLKASAILIAELPDLIPEVEEVFHDAISAVTDLSTEAAQKFVSDVGTAFKDFGKTFSGDAQQVQDFKAAVQKLITDATSTGA